MRGGSVGGGGQRISEISIDLVSESDECADDAGLLAVGTGTTNTVADTEELQRPLSRTESSAPLQQIEQFQRFLSADEKRIFFMVQNKFNEYLAEELANVRQQHEGELKILADTLDAEKLEKETEVRPIYFLYEFIFIRLFVLQVNRLRQLLANTKGGSPELLELRRELESIHGREMEDLRTYFERKCADLEKQ